mmetsp:Transcript_13606/g.27165  ORF Transcript_13606/g.27165 Transcript_13606/m.27165 type:complete len:256 (-) Transcript_13606:147-914(-)
MAFSQPIDRILNLISWYINRHSMLSIVLDVCNWKCLFQCIPPVLHSSNPAMIPCGYLLLPPMDSSGLNVMPVMLVVMRSRLLLHREQSSHTEQCLATLRIQHINRKMLIPPHGDVLRMHIRQPFLNCLHHSFPLRRNLVPGLIWNGPLDILMSQCPLQCLVWTHNKHATIPEIPGNVASMPLYMIDKLIAVAMEPYESLFRMLQPTPFRGTRLDLVQAQACRTAFGSQHGQSPPLPSIQATSIVNYPIRKIIRSL